MLNADPLTQRPKLLNATLLARALDGLRRRADSPAEVWRRLTEQYVVDLDAVAALLPSAEPQAHWLTARD